MEENCALRLRAIRDFNDDDGETKNAGDEWLFTGPSTYIPRVEEEMVEVIQATVVKHDMALKLRANRACTDSAGTAISLFSPPSLDFSLTFHFLGGQTNRCEA